MILTQTTQRRAMRHAFGSRLALIRKPEFTEPCPAKRGRFALGALGAVLRWRGHGFAPQNGALRAVASTGRLL